MHIDLLDQPHPQALRLQQVGSSAIVVSSGTSSGAGKAAHRLHLVEQILHARIAHAARTRSIDPKRIGAAATASLRKNGSIRSSSCCQGIAPSSPGISRRVRRFFESYPRKSHLKGLLSSPVVSYHYTRLVQSFLRGSPRDLPPALGPDAAGERLSENGRGLPGPLHGHGPADRAGCNSV